MIVDVDETGFRICLHALSDQQIKELLSSLRLDKHSGT
jgi:hypothetical protein